MTSLYHTDWSPHGIRKQWLRTSMDLKSSIQLLGNLSFMVRGRPSEAIAWFDDYGSLRVLAIITDQKILTCRLLRSGWKLQNGPLP